MKETNRKSCNSL